LTYWIFSVTPENWQIAREQKIWSVRTENLAQKVNKGDFIVLYVSGTESFCSIIEILEDWHTAAQPVWPDEIEENRIKYPYQTKVKIIQEGLANIKKMLQKLSFIKNKQKWGVYVQGTPANMRRPISESDYQSIQNVMKSNALPQDITTLLEVKRKIIRKTSLEEEAPTLVPKHNEIRDMLSEIGKIEGKNAEVEYPIDGLRLDVVWKTITTGNPKWVFEVQLAGNFYEALTKLKHAWDKWNSKPFLVTTETYIAQAKSLLQGSFHEMKDDARIVNWEKIVKLHQLLKDAYKIKSEIRF
jgi:predicted RNA-binding protein